MMPDYRGRGNLCPSCLNENCDVMQPAGSATARGSINYMVTPLQRVQQQFAETLELARTTLNEREYDTMVEILIARAAAEGARMAWRQEQAS